MAVSVETKVFVSVEVLNWLFYIRPVKKKTPTVSLTQPARYRNVQTNSDVFTGHNLFLWNQPVCTKRVNKELTSTRIKTTTINIYDHKDQFIGTTGTS